jgi:oligopeptide/dipeptide ABC transporter ATP-binding protein
MSNAPDLMAAAAAGEPDLAEDEILRVHDLCVHFFTPEGVVKAVDGASFAVKSGQVLGVVGESGCGKSVTALSILRILPRSARITRGSILYRRQLRDGEAGDGGVSEIVDLARIRPGSREMRDLRGGEIAMVFQEPMTSLDPLYTVGNQLMEAVTLHQKVGSKEARQRAIEMLTAVGLPEPARTVDSYPHQLSGGMRQRVMIAIGLSCRPSLLLADEPTTALDVTTEAQILDLVRQLQHEFGTAIMYITHNLGIIAEICHDVIVMYLGKVVEQADVDTIFFEPRHPYTQGLQRSIPELGKRAKHRLEPIKGIVPDARAIPAGCPFWPRCPQVIPQVCNVREPANIVVGPGHTVRCHLYGSEVSA